MRVIGEQLAILKQDDAKIRSLVETLNSIEAKSPGTKVLIFSYFSDTVSYLQEHLANLTPHITDLNIGFVSSNNGSDSERLASRFSPVSKRYTLKADEVELQFLVATDVLSEGQNLQDAGTLINYDLHWNPVRMIQRNGRVNRLGTQFKVVSIHNMRPERKLDSYLNLVQRLQGKIDMIRNTIGTDTPVLDEPDNPIEYADAIRDIYSVDEQVRIKALIKAEKAADFLLAEDDYVFDLIEFHNAHKDNIDYRNSIYNISKGKWSLQPQSLHRTIARTPLFALVELFLEPSGISHQFVAVDESDMSIQALSNLQALEWLKTDPTDSVRKKDNLKRNRTEIKDLVENSAKVYLQEAELGAPIGQENDLLRILYDLGFDQEVIESVRLAFKSRDLFHKRSIDQLKRKIMTAKRNGGIYHEYIAELIEIARDIQSNEINAQATRVLDAKAVLFYEEGN